MNKAVMWMAGLGMAAGAAYGQQSGAGEMPRVVLTVPGDVAPEKVAIRYFLTGEFGGYGSFVPTTADERRYEIVAGVDGRAATEIKIVAFMPGCEFETFDETLTQPEVAETLECRPVRMTALRGQIEAGGSLDEGPYLVRVTYVAGWANRFFGIYDGMVMMIPLGVAEVDSSGAFQIMVPSFTGKAGEGSADLEFFLDRGKSGDRAARLELADKSGMGSCLTASADYPEVVRLVAVSQ